MTWIKTIDPSEAGGILKEEYEAAVRRAGKVYSIVRVSSLRPDLLRSWINLYITLMHRPGKLDRRQREMLAVVVSRTNDCFY